MGINIAITAGGTGGHYFPAKALSDNLIKNGYNVSVFLDKRAYKYKHIWDKNINIYQISSLGFQKKNFTYILRMLFSIGMGFLQSVYHFIKKRPKAVVSFGGYSSIPGIMAAIILRIPIIIHEQNAILGKANKLFVKYAKVVALTFADTKNIPNNIKSDIVGLPVRKEFILFRSKYKEKSQHSDFVVCVLGGSLGAKIFADNIPSAFALFSENLQKKITVYHQCREEFIQITEEKWKQTKINYIIKPFFNNIPEILWKTDMVIARSGSSSIAEINIIGRYAVYVPYALAAENHQELNAVNAQQYSGADYILEKDFTPNSLFNFVQECMNNPHKIEQKSTIAKNSAKINSADQLTKIINNVTGI